MSEDSHLWWTMLHLQYSAAAGAGGRGGGGVQEQRERAVQVAGKEVPHLEFQFWQMALNPSGS